MKRFYLILFSFACCISAFAQQIVSSDVKVGPWVTAVRVGEDGEASAKILWTSEHSGMGWVELEDGTRVYDSFAGRRAFGTYHCVTVKDLPAGKPVRYRVGGQLLLDDSNSVKPIFGDEYCDVWTSFKTFDNEGDECRFSMMNDIHMHLDSYRSLVSQIDSTNTDFIFLCGDIISKGNYILDTLLRYEIEPLGSLASGMPVQFARGNHEGRGNGIREVAKVYPQADDYDDGGEFFYTFREGPVAFAVFDGGETGIDRSIIFSGGDYYVEYIDEQIEWARSAFLRPEFKKAPIKVCLIHVPMIDHSEKDDYHLQRYLNQKVVPLLNDAGFNLMLGADLHEHMYCPAGSMGNDFPILVNENEQRLDFVFDGKQIYLKTFKPSGEETGSYVIPAKKRPFRLKRSR